MKSNLTCIVDDDNICHLLFKKQIQNISFANDCLTFSNGKVAFEYFKDNINNKLLLPDIIFLDINMPIMNGWDFLKKYEEKILPQISKSIKIYLISTSLNEIDVKRVNENSLIIDFIEKPFKRDVLLNILI